MLSIDARRGGVLVLALALGGAMAGCADTGTEPQDPDYLPLAVGNTWTYAPESPVFGEAFTWTVTSRTADMVTLARPAGGSHPGPVRLLVERRAVDLLTDDGPALHSLFEAGVFWTRHDPWECDDGATFGGQFDPEPVTTPAGTFEGTLRIERRTTASCTDAGTMVEWWAPGVGLVKWEELNFYAGGPLAFYLVAYDVE